MTEKLIEVFPWSGGSFQIEPDASSGSYFLAARELAPSFKGMERSEQYGVEVQTERNSSIEVSVWPRSGLQADQWFEEFLSLGLLFHSVRKVGKQGELATKAAAEAAVKDLRISRVSRKTDLADSIMTAIILVAGIGERFTWYGERVDFTDLGRLRVQECERVVALRTELTKCGAKVIEEGDTLTVYPAKPGELHGAEIETYNDHRMAMCFAILGLKVPGIRLKNPACVKKTFPNFFQKLAAAPPNGLGVEIWEVKDGKRTRKLEGDDLFAG
jgi:3-phosphoshikimate 1-carboxyvinyltransferase